MFAAERSLMGLNPRGWKESMARGEGGDSEGREGQVKGLDLILRAVGSRLAPSALQFGEVCGWRLGGQ